MGFGFSNALQSNENHAEIRALMHDVEYAQKENIQNFIKINKGMKSMANKITEITDRVNLAVETTFMWEECM